MKKISIKEMPQKHKLFLAILLLAMIILLVSSFESGSGESSVSTSSFNATDYKLDLEKRLSETLASVCGVGEVEVLITLEAENSKEIKYNETESKSTSSSSTYSSQEQANTSKQAIMVNQNGESTPYTIEGSYPEISGVVVVAEGAYSTQTKSYITDAIKTSLNISAHKIVVLPKK